jgi:hypothetical protein
MARFISSIGQITGKLGDVVFRTRGNKTFISKAPEHIKTASDPFTKLRRKKFAWVGKFASAVNSFPLLKALWNSQPSRIHSSFNQIFKQVFKTYPCADYSGPVAFTPDNSFSLKSRSVTFGKSSIFAEVAPLGVNLGIDPAKELSIVAAGVIVFSDPENQSFPEEFFLPVQSGKLPVSLFAPSVFIIPLTGRDLSIYDTYRTKKIYLTLITLDASGSPVHHSVIIS